MASFNDAIAALITSLKTNSALLAFIQTIAPQKTLTVLQVFKPRIEVSGSDLPIILITRPQIDPTYQENSVYGGHKLRLYFGFQEDDREQGAKNHILFEEKLRDALLADPSTGGTTENVTPGVAVNDEGRNHPNYFGMMEVDVMHKR